MKPQLPYLILLLILVSHTVSAHRINLQFTVENNQLVIHATDGTNSSIPEATVSIFDHNGELLTQELTDESGEFRWGIDSVRDIQVRLYAGAGHAQSISISQDQLSAMMLEPDHNHNELSHHNHSHLDDNSDGHSHDTIEYNDSLSANVATNQPVSTTIISTENSWGMPERMILGFTFILAAWSAWTSHRNTKKLDQLLKIHDLNNHDHQK